LIRYLASAIIPARRPKIVGIVNITEDSFSDGGRYLATQDALAHARQLRSEGADIIELGPAASHPGAANVPAEDQRRRLAPVIEHLAADNIPVSVDSPVPGIQRFALAHGAAYLNDIHGFPDPGMYEQLSAAGCRLVVMHSVHRQEPVTKVITEPAATWAAIDRFFADRLAVLRAAGIARERLVIDPGLGYFLGANPEPSLAALAGIGQLKARFGLPVLISPSRKSFLRAVTGRDSEQIGAATVAAELYAVGQGADYVRTHDVRDLNDALTILDAIARQVGWCERAPTPPSLPTPG